MKTATRNAGAAQGLLILVASALPVMGVVLLSPTAQQIREAMGKGPEAADLASLVLTAPALAIAVFSPLGGYLMDRVGRRVCFLSALFVYALLGVAPIWLESPLAIVIARFGLGMTEAVILAATVALLGDYYTGATRDRWVAYMMAVAATAATLFYIAGGFLGEISWKAPFAAYSASFIIFLFAWRLIFEPDREVRAPLPPSAAPGRRGARLSLGLATVLASTLVGAILFYIVPLQLAGFLQGRGIASSATIGLLIALAGLGNPLGAVTFRFLRQFPIPMLLAGSAAVSGAGLMIAAFSRDVAGLVVGAFVNQLGCGIFCPITMAAVLRMAPPDRRGATGGGWSTAFFVGQFLSPLVILQLVGLDRHGDGLLVLACANFIFAGLSSWLIWKAAAVAGRPAEAAVETASVDFTPVRPEGSLRRERS